MDYSTFVQALREVAKKRGMTQEQVEDIMCFSSAKSRFRGARQTDFCTFTRALKEIVDSEAMTHEQVEDILCLKFESEHEDVRAGINLGFDDVFGPERFYYDVSLYTGCHKHGGPSLAGSGGKTPQVDFKSLVNRDRGIQLEASAERRSKQPLGRGTDDKATSLSNSTRVLREGKLKAARSASIKHGSPVRGPERFYYDKSSYTGTHKNGGPTVTGNGLVKKGYNDLSELVCRDLIQDDDLHRRSRRRRALSTTADSYGSSDSPPPPPQPCLVQEPLPVLLGARTPACILAKQSSEKVPVAPLPAASWIHAGVKALQKQHPSAKSYVH